MRGLHRHRATHTRYRLIVLENKVGDEPIVLLTNQVIRNETDVEEFANAYHDRWGAEEAFRFLKQGFDLENLRALTWRGLKRTVLLVMLAYGFLSSLVFTAREAVEKLLSTVKAFGRVPEYMFYRMLEGAPGLVREQER